MQQIPGMERVQWAEKEAKIRSAAQSTQQQTMRLRGIERAVVQEIEAWQRDKDATHLLRAISALQCGMNISAGVASTSAGAAAELSGVPQPYQPDPPAGFNRSGGDIPSAGLPGATQSDIDRAADYAKSKVRQGFSNLESKVQRAAKLLEDVAEAARQGGLGTQGGFGGRAAGGAIPSTQQGGYGGRAGGSTQQQGGSGTQSGFGGRASGRIP